jgi:hypothetical protein
MDDAKSNLKLVSLLRLKSVIPRSLLILLFLLFWMNKPTRHKRILPDGNVWYAKVEPPSSTAKSRNTEPKSAPCPKGKG